MSIMFDNNKTAFATIALNLLLVVVVSVAGAPITNSKLNSNTTTATPTPSSSNKTSEEAIVVDKPYEILNISNTTSIIIPGDVEYENEESQPTQIHQEEGLLKRLVDWLGFGLDDDWIDPQTLIMTCAFLIGIALIAGVIACTYCLFNSSAKCSSRSRRVRRQRGGESHQHHHNASFGGMETPSLSGSKRSGKNKKLSKKERKRLAEIEQTNPLYDKEKELQELVVEDKNENNNNDNDMVPSTKTSATDYFGRLSETEKFIDDDDENESKGGTLTRKPPPIPLESPPPTAEGELTPTSQGSSTETLTHLVEEDEIRNHKYSGANTFDSSSDDSNINGAHDTPDSIVKQPNNNKGSSPVKRMFTPSGLHKSQQQVNKEANKGYGGIYTRTNSESNQSYNRQSILSSTSSNIGSSQSHLPLNFGLVENDIDHMVVNVDHHKGRESSTSTSTTAGSQQKLEGGAKSGQSVSDIYMDYMKSEKEKKMKAKNDASKTPDSKKQKKDNKNNKDEKRHSIQFNQNMSPLVSLNPMGGGKVATSNKALNSKAGISSSPSGPGSSSVNASPAAAASALINKSRSNLIYNESASIDTLASEKSCY